MRYCKKCGAEIPEGVDFCEKCGSPVRKVPRQGKRKKKWVIAISIVIVILAEAVARLFATGILENGDDVDFGGFNIMLGQRIIVYDGTNGDEIKKAAGPVAVVVKDGKVVIAKTAKKCYNKL